MNKQSQLKNLISKLLEGKINILSEQSQKPKLNFRRAKAAQDKIVSGRAVMKVKIPYDIQLINVTL